MIIKLLVEGGEMKPGPTLSQKLGPAGINMNQVLQKINESTADFKGLKVPVELDVDVGTKIFEVKVFSPPVSELLKRELKIEKGSGTQKKQFAANASIEQIISVAKTKFSNMLCKDLKSAVKTVVGTCVSLGVLIENKSPVEIEHEIDEGKEKGFLRSDEKGNIIEGSLIGALLSKAVLQKASRKGETIVYTIGCSRIVPETIREYYGKPFRERVGHSFVNAAMRKTQAIFGTEHTGHYFYKDNFYTESPIITSLMICNILSRTNKKMSSLVKPFQKYYMTKELSFHVRDQARAMAKIKQALRLKYKKIETFDGLFVDCDTHWFRIRASQTEQLIRVVIEGISKNQVERVKAELTAMIKNAIR